MDTTWCWCNHAPKCKIAFQAAQYIAGLNIASSDLLIDVQSYISSSVIPIDLEAINACKSVPDL